MAASYLDSPLFFKVKKVARYLSLYGISRTIIKYQAQVHMGRKLPFEGNTWINPDCSELNHPDRFAAIIGCGNFAYSALGYYLRKSSKYFLKAACDINASAARSLCRDFGGAYATTRIEEIIADPSIRLVFIASNHASHAEYAIQCMNAGKSVHIEKPHVVSEDQLERLLEAQRNNPGVQVFLGFNRPRSEHFRRICKALGSQPGPITLSWFVVGHKIPDDHWYYSDEEGGRILGNLCHWTDLTLAMVGLEKAFPCEVVPASPPKDKSNFCVGVKFADGSLASLTFAARGETFEGVRETLNAQRGDALISMKDFKETTIDIVEKRTVYKSFHRDHGHGVNVQNSYDAIRENNPARAVSPSYNLATAKLFLAARKALTENRTVKVEL